MALLQSHSIDLKSTELAGVHTFERLQASFQEARERRADLISEAYYCFAERLVHLRIVGKDLAQFILPAFSHLKTDFVSAKAPQLTIDLWDECETEVRCPIERPYDTPSEYRILSASPDSRFLSEYNTRTLVVFDRKTQSIIGSFASLLLRWLKIKYPERQHSRCPPQHHLRLRSSQNIDLKCGRPFPAEFENTF